MSRSNPPGTRRAGGGGGSGPSGGGRGPGGGEMVPPLSARDAAVLAEGLARGVPLPASWYTDPAVLTLEEDRIFRRSWQYVGRAEQLARPGDYLTAEVGGLPVVVVR